MARGPGAATWSCCACPEAVSLASLGQTLHELGRPERSLDNLTRALALQREIGDRGGEGETLRVVAEVHRDTGRLAQALEHADAAVELAGELGERRLLADALNTQASVHHRLGRQRHEALVLERPASYRLLEGQALATVAGIHLRLGRPDRALGRPPRARRPSRQRPPPRPGRRPAAARPRALPHRRRRHRPAPPAAGPRAVHGARRPEARQVAGLPEEGCQPAAPGGRPAGQPPGPGRGGAPAWMARTVAIVSASSARLSSR
jgi:tetratricopeptide (TPR) repeat protein